MQISARADYAVRAMLELAAAPRTVTAQALADAQGLPHKFLEAILGDLRRAGLVRSLRGAEGGYRLARPAEDIAVGDVIRAVDGPLAGVRGMRPEQASYEGVAANLQTVWVATRAAVRGVLDETSLADVVSGKLSPHLRRLVNSPQAWEPR
ncbi:RrF2 family transcriptional regulator [Actinopolymorpha singaporensis]|uniref:Rrf2 family protein n=1 Tax=Actinopolymorpha singaporensis TaxID=117157 RepID=A0A1H1L4C8_9ACTN|nr:Rrf2 family transcriptional regulator [Actinopolymorpha singaporensis]SDR69190.1 Rrf2 family protein [Actinopolymorpha singaporensis]